MSSFLFCIYFSLFLSFIPRTLSSSFSNFPSFVVFLYSSFTLPFSVSHHVLPFSLLLIYILLHLFIFCFVNYGHLHRLIGDSTGARTLKSNASVLSSSSAPKSTVTGSDTAYGKYGKDGIYNINSSSSSSSTGHGYSNGGGRGVRGIGGVGGAYGRAGQAAYSGSTNNTSDAGLDGLSGRCALSHTPSSSSTYSPTFMYLYFSLPILEHLCLISPSSLSPHFLTLHFIPCLYPISYPLSHYSPSCSCLLFFSPLLPCPLVPFLFIPPFALPSITPSLHYPSLHPFTPVPCFLSHSPVSLPPCPSHFLPPTFLVDKRIAIFHVF